MLEKLLRYAGELEKLEAHKLSNEEYANLLVLESELTPNDFVLLDDLQWCQRWKQPVWMNDIWPKADHSELKPPRHTSNYVSSKMTGAEESPS